MVNASVCTQWAAWMLCSSHPMAAPKATTPIILKISPNPQGHFGRVGGREGGCAMMEFHKNCNVHDSHDQYAKITLKISDMNDTSIFVRFSPSQIMTKNWGGILKSLQQGEGWWCGQIFAPSAGPHHAASPPCSGGFPDFHETISKGPYRQGSHWRAASWGNRWWLDRIFHLHSYLPI